MKLKELDLYITEKCNLQCEFCSICANATSRRELDYQTIIKLVNQAKELEVEDIHITGGEPTLHPNIIEIISYIDKSGIKSRLITNGTLLTYNKLVEIKQAGLKDIMISLDGLQKFNNTVRGNGSYEKTMKVIEAAIKLDYNVRVNTVAWNENRDDIIKVGKIIETMGGTIYSVFMGSPVGRAEQLSRLSVINSNGWLALLNDMKQNFQNSKMKVVVEKGYIFGHDDVFDVHNLRSCQSIVKNTDYLSIRADGNIYPCVFFSNSDKHIGNIKVDSLDSVKDNLLNSEFYKFIAEIPERCNECSKANICKGGCKGFSEETSSFEKDTRCDLSNKHIPICPIIKLSISEGKLAACTDDLV